MLSLLVENHRIPFLNVAKCFIWHNEKKLINEFTIGYMINPGLNVNKVFKKIRKLYVYYIW